MMTSCRLISSVIVLGFRKKILLFPYILQTNLENILHNELTEAYIVFQEFSIVGSIFLVSFMHLFISNRLTYHKCSQNFLLMLKILYLTLLKLKLLLMQYSLSNLKQGSIWTENHLTSYQTSVELEFWKVSRVLNQLQINNLIAINTNSLFAR